jgi:hypothetical protein
LPIWQYREVNTISSLFPKTENTIRFGLTAMNKALACAGLALFFCLGSSVSRADGTSPVLEAKLQTWITLAEKWAAAPEIVNAVHAQNLALPSVFSALNQETWAALDRRDPALLALKVNPAAKYLRSCRNSFTAELFVNDAVGRKVAMLDKTTSWNHAGKAKHEQPMLGKPWRGSIEFDDSTSTKLIQISVPVFEDGRPIGSLVIGINIFELASN